MSECKERKTVIVGLPIVRKLLAGEDVELESLGVTLIPDDVLWNARVMRIDAVAMNEETQQG